jgi:hypothetical protein
MRSISQIRENAVNSAASTLRCVRPAQSQPADPLAETPLRGGEMEQALWGLRGSQLALPRLVMKWAAELPARSVLPRLPRAARCQESERRAFKLGVRHPRVESERGASKIIETRPDDVPIALRAALVPKPAPTGSPACQRRMTIRVIEDLCFPSGATTIPASQALGTARSQLRKSDRRTAPSRARSMGRPSV